MQSDRQTDRQVRIGHHSGKTAHMKRVLDEWLMTHPYVKALILDPFSDRVETRHFEPHKQIEKTGEESL